MAEASNKCDRPAYDRALQAWKNLLEIAKALKDKANESVEV
jgi:hypothetical protein